MSVLMIFWDGVGIGKKDSKINPFFHVRLPFFEDLFEKRMVSLGQRTLMNHNTSVTPVNATLGIPHLPQSGTGQAAIMTGLNAPKIVGRHFGPYPHSSLRPLIVEQNLFLQLQRIGKKTIFANAYPDKFFHYLQSPKGKYPVMALSSVSAGMPLNGHEQVASHRAISADITAEKWHDFGHSDISAVTPQQAGEIFCGLSQSVDFILFEYFLTDNAGHSRNMELAENILQRMDGFLEGIASRFNHSEDILLIVSDHGNIEDLSVKTHTRNPIPLIALGKNRSYFSQRIKTLADIAPAIVSFFS
jgi:2,3-bisphosphoglycerate-independent phosphoglycerate mutase